MIAIVFLEDVGNVEVLGLCLEAGNRGRMCVQREQLRPPTAPAPTSRAETGSVLQSWSGMAFSALRRITSQ